MRLRLRALWPAGLAVAGMVAGHWLGFALAVPNGAHRAQVLTLTGHSRWEMIVALAIFGGALALALRLSRAVRDGMHDRTVDAAFMPLTVRLTTLQMSLFVVMESLERASHGGLSASLLLRRPFVIGLIVQAAVAALIALAVRELTRAAAAVGRLLRARETYSPTTVVVPVVRYAPLRVRPLASASGVRGPPSR